MSDQDNPKSASEGLLEGSLLALEPLIRLLVAEGVTHPRFAAALKAAFVRAARAELEARGQKETQSALSLLSGIQRFELRAMDKAAGPWPRKAQVHALHWQVAMRWFTDPRFRSEDDLPRVLPLRSPDPDAPSFASLVASVSTDIPATTVLEALLRAGAVTETAEGLQLNEGAFTPAHDRLQVFNALAWNVRDLMNAGVANVRSGERKFLEFSVLADELRPESAEELHKLAKQLARHAFKRTAQAAEEKIERDRARGFADVPEQQVRFGMYFYSQDKAPAPAPAAPGEPGREGEGDGGAQQKDPS